MHIYFLGFESVLIEDGSDVRCTFCDPFIEARVVSVTNSLIDHIFLRTNSDKHIQRTKVSVMIHYTVEEEHGILTFKTQVFSLPHFHFQFKSVNTSTIFTSKLKTRLYIWRLVSWLTLRMYTNKQISLNCMLFLHPAFSRNAQSWQC